MPYLMVNLDDWKDCRRAMRHLRGVLGEVTGELEAGAKGGAAPGKPWRAGKGRAGEAEPWLGQPSASAMGWAGKGRADSPENQAAIIRKLPLKAKLERMKQRGVWPHLVAIASQGEVAKSLAEFDRDLTLPPNKMRSLKAIMAKLENRFDLRFLEVEPQAGQDEAGNPRYAMPRCVRKQILKLAAT
jgi:hypothetical protein